ncbi:MAG: hypothetical protein IJM84_06830 [Bacteroidaceae bacterium]|nr:hypothetical protein [Bacteroidaceae bacterium]
MNCIVHNHFPNTYYIGYHQKILHLCRYKKNILSFHLLNNLNIYLFLSRNTSYNLHTLRHNNKDIALCLALYI